MNFAPIFFDHNSHAKYHALFSTPVSALVTHHGGRRSPIDERVFGVAPMVHPSSTKTHRSPAPPTRRGGEAVPAPRLSLSLLKLPGRRFYQPPKFFSAQTNRNQHDSTIVHHQPPGTQSRGVFVPAITSLSSSSPSGGKVLPDWWTTCRYPEAGIGGAAGQRCEPVRILVVIIIIVSMGDNHGGDDQERKRRRIITIAKEGTVDASKERIDIVVAAAEEAS
jgi:hypothetical protein